MHETGVVRNLVHQVQTVAQEHGASSVTGVRVKIGWLSGFSAEHLREHFEQDTKGTLCEGADLQIEVDGDMYSPNAQEIMLESISMEVEEPATVD